MKRIFILDDDRNRILLFEQWYQGYDLSIAITADEAIDILSKRLDFDMITLDHDLGGEVYCSSDLPNSGYRVAKFLSTQKYKGLVVIHTHNPPGAQNMKSVLPNALIRPFQPGRII